MVDILGRSRTHVRLLDMVSAAATHDVEVLIQGPSGVGKELYARLIHERSQRAAHAFIPVNCGALPAELFENELFGHQSGAFTGARTRTQGLVAEAEHGTLFLDEVDALPLSAQVKLLRFIQQKEYRPLGASRMQHSDVRIIAATNTDLLQEARAGHFRFDLFFRLRVVPLEVPPLSERPEDIAPLLEHFLLRYAAEYGRPTVTFSDAALERLYTYPWPGNVRELENCARFLLCAHGGARVDVSDLPLLPEPRREPPPADAVVPAWREPFQEAKRRVVEAFERAYLQESLVAHAGNIAAAARASGKHRRAFFELMRRHGLTER
ncbi:sigma 54-interacting transcriptional regulator [Corallococcus llansteffanensis]|uniref:Sigma-54-dependent Fis family transcriptional regulator n=1 Tax=Corallococcus llansteffanensis TaxID=2316731 RepID=A0A3A8NKV8_9BACT|nr:sigma-54 dependent transcriptional regulator [Corallococcus llansteffanensis]RKH44858.1 sigma-54-dependent Fis family transcriptional regulator [Corallococcus llansteffanensis]